MVPQLPTYIYGGEKRWQLRAAILAVGLTQYAKSTVDPVTGEVISANEVLRQRLREWDRQNFPRTASEYFPVAPVRVKTKKRSAKQTDPKDTLGIKQSSNMTQYDNGQFEDEFAIREEEDQEMIDVDAMEFAHTSAHVDENPQRSNANILNMSKKSQSGIATPGIHHGQPGNDYIVAERANLQAESTQGAVQKPATMTTSKDLDSAVEAFDPSAHKVDSYLHTPSLEESRIMNPNTLNYAELMLYQSQIEVYKHLEAVPEDRAVSGTTQKLVRDRMWRRKMDENGW